MKAETRKIAAEKLTVNIYREGKLVEVVELPDPRIEFVKQFNEHHPDGYLRAEID